MKHITVLQKEATHELNLTKDSVVVDCTLGAGGHANEMLTKLGKKGVLVGIDADETAIRSYQAELTPCKAALHLVHGNFRNIKSILNELEINSVDAILADLGWRMEQFDGSSGLPRGFSFKNDEPLSMTFGHPDKYAFTAYDIINDWKEEDIANVIYAYGEERFSRRIAKAIVTQREDEPIGSSMVLAEIVSKSLPGFAKGKKKAHPATKTFQALRIAVNDEFDALKELLADGFELLAPQGRMAIISFHSLEDRIVKETFRTYTRDQLGVLVHKKPLTASLEEQSDNPRARSAKLRIIEKI